MNTSYKAAFVVSGLILLGTSGCVSPSIVLRPDLPTVAASPVAGTSSAISVTVKEGAIFSQATKYEEKREKTLIGKSESLGVHLSDIWMDEPPPAFVRRLLEHTVTAWGFSVVPGKGSARMQGNVREFLLNSRAINAFEFQADGVIDVEVTVSDALGTPLYGKRYVGRCSRRTATEMPTREHLETLFGRCIQAFQDGLEADAALRSALSSI